MYKVINVQYACSNKFLIKLEFLKVKLLKIFEILTTRFTKDFSVYFIPLLHPRRPRVY